MNIVVAGAAGFLGSPVVLELTGSKSAIESRPLPEDDPKVRRPDIARARTLLGWEPSIALRDGLARSVEFFRTLPAERLTSRARPKSALER